MTHRDLTDSQMDVLAELYADTRCMLDDLPYTEDFDAYTCSSSAKPARRFIGTSCGRHCPTHKAGKLIRKER